MPRKAAFFLRRAALCQIQFARWGFAGSLLLKVCEAYRLCGLNDRLRGGDGTRGVDPVIALPRSHNGGNDPLTAVIDGWPMLQAMVIRDIMYIYMKLEDHTRKARVVAYFCVRIKAPSAREMLPGLLVELSKSSRTTICPQGLIGVPALSYLVPQDPVAASIPIQCAPPVRAPVEAGPFIYSPFKRGSVLEKKTLWVADEIMTVQLRICNPLPINLLVDSIVLYADGKFRLEACPISGLKLTAGQGWRTIELQCKALQTGRLKLGGCLIRAFNVDSFHPLSSEVVEIVAPMPKLVVSAECGEVSAGQDVTVNALLGERRTAVVRITNPSKLQVAGFRVSASPVDADGAVCGRETTIHLYLGDAAGNLDAASKLNFPGATVRMGLGSIQRALPLQPGATASFSIDFVTTTTTFYGLALRIEYCEKPFESVAEDPASTSIHYRRLQLLLSVAVVASLEPSDFSIKRCGGSALAASFVAESSLLSSAAIDNGGGAAAAAADVAADTGFIEEYDDALFVYAFSVKNKCADAFTATVIRDQQVVRQMTIQGFCTSRVRVILAKKSLGNVRGEDGGIDLTLLRSALGRVVQLKWRQNHTCGEVPVHVPSDAITASTAAVVLQPKLRLRHMLAVGRVGTATASRSAQCRCHDTIQLTAAITNMSSAATRPCTLSILTVQSAESGSLIPTSWLLLTPLGSMASTVPSLQPGETYEHTAGFLCLARGRYVLSYMCDTRGGVHEGSTKRPVGTPNQEVFWGTSIVVQVT